MQTNHVLKHGKEVEEEQASYSRWRLKVGNTTINVTNDKLITLLAGTNFSFTVDGDQITLNASAAAFKKPNKPISDATYVLKEEDATKWLIFTTNCEVTVPTGLSIHNIIEGEAYTGATVTFKAGNGMNLRHTDSISKTLSPNGPFGVRYNASNDAILYGTDPTNYLNQ